MKKDFQDKAKNSLLKHAHKILDETVLLPVKQINNPVIQESFTIVFKLYDLLKEKMEIDHLCCTTQFLLYFMLHPLTPVYQKYKILTYFNSIVQYTFLSK